MPVAAILAEAIPLLVQVTKSIEAAQNGDEEAAKAYLSEARSRFDQASRLWDDAGSGD